MSPYMILLLVSIVSGESVITPKNALTLSDANYCGESGNGTLERFSELRMSNNQGYPPVNVTKGSIELILATLTPSQSYYMVNSTLSIIKWDVVLESVHFPLGNMTGGSEKTLNTPFFIPGGAASGDAVIKFEAFNDNFENIICFLLDVLIYDAPLGLNFINENY